MIVMANPYRHAWDNPAMLDKYEHQSEVSSGMAIAYGTVPPFAKPPTEEQMRALDMYEQIKQDRKRRRPDRGTVEL